MSQRGTPSWSFLTNHAQVLALHRTRVNELAAVGYISRARNGRRNRYAIKSRLPLPEPLAGQHRVGDLLAVLAGQNPRLETSR